MRRDQRLFSEEDFFNPLPHQVDKVDFLEGSARQGQQNLTLKEETPVGPLVIDLITSFGVILHWIYDMAFI